MVLDWIKPLRFQAATSQYVWDRCVYNIYVCVFTTHTVKPQRRRGSSPQLRQRVWPLTFQSRVRRLISIHSVTPKNIKPPSSRQSFNSVQIKDNCVSFFFLCSDVFVSVSLSPPFSFICLLKVIAPKRRRVKGVF